VETEDSGRDSNMSYTLETENVDHNGRELKGIGLPAQEKFADALRVDHLHQDLKGRSVRGGAVSIAAQCAQIVLQSVSTVVLARLLTPVDFGLVAMVTAITAIAAGFADLGLTEATIQRKEISHDQVSMLFWINTGMGLLLTLITALLAPVLAWFYKEPRLFSITLVVSLSFLISGLRGQHNALLKRQMRFSSVAIRDVTCYLIAVPVAIFLAWRGAGYWAIVALPLVLNSTQLVMSWWMVDWRPGLPRRGVGVRSLVTFGGNVAASYVVFNWLRNADNVLIGWYWGAGPLGFYSRAFNLLTLALSQITGPASNVAIPALSRIQSDADLFAKYYLRIINVIMWIVATLFGFLFVAAAPVIVIVLGRKWEQAAPVFQILALSALGQMLLESTLWTFVSRGESARLLKLLLVITPCMVGSFAIGLPFGIKWVALALSLFLLASLPWIMHFSFRGTSLTLRRLFGALLYPTLVAVVGVGVADLAMFAIAPQNTGSQLLTAILGFATAYSAAFLFRPVRQEIVAFWNLLGELGLFVRLRRRTS
jgi:PST family polysaccharide transporter